MYLGWYKISRQSDDSSPLTKWIKIFCELFNSLYLTWNGQVFKISQNRLKKSTSLFSENNKSKKSQGISNKSWALVYCNGILEMDSRVSKRGQCSHSADTFVETQDEERMALRRYPGDCLPCRCQHSINMIIAVLFEQAWVAIVTTR